MSNVKLSIPNISCEHCAKTIQAALSSQPAVRSIEVEVPARQVFLNYDETRLSISEIKAILEAEDYPVQSERTQL